MDFSDLRKHWDTLGRTDPLWAILSEESRRGGRWDPVEFFDTGRRDVQALMAALERLGAPLDRGHALDFGCGVGRVTQSLCEHFGRCTGVDISAAMIREAERYNRHGARCRYVLNERPDLRRFADAEFDFVYSGLVLQHMVPELTRGYLREFLRVTSPGGVVAFQLPSHHVPPEDDTSLPHDACRARIELLREPPDMVAGATVLLGLRVTNASDLTWPALEGSRSRLALGNHWRDGDGRILQFDDGRATLQGELAPGGSIDLELSVRVPELSGSYTIEFDVVQEFVTWFHATGSPTLWLPVAVRAAPSAGVARGEAARAPAAPIAGPSPSASAGPGLGRAFRLLAADLRSRLRGVATVPSPRMEMYGIPREEVEGLIRECSGRLLDVREEFSAPGWVGFLYFVTPQTP